MQKLIATLDHVVDSCLDLQEEMIRDNMSDLDLIKSRIISISKYFTVEGPKIKSENGVKAENIKIKHENFSSSLNSEHGDIALTLLNNYALTKYKAQTNQFKRLIGKENKFLAIF